MYDYETEVEKLSFSYLIILIFFVLEMISLGILYLCDLTYIWTKVMVYLNIFFVLLAIKVRIDTRLKNSVKSIFLIAMIIFFAVNCMVLTYHETMKFFWGTKTSVEQSPEKINTMIIEKENFRGNMEYKVYKKKWFIYKKIEMNETGNWMAVQWIDEDSAYIIINGAKNPIEFN